MDRTEGKIIFTVYFVMILMMGIFSLPLPVIAGGTVEAQDERIEEATKIRVQEAYGKLPLYFIQNDGQVDEKVKFYEKGSGHSTYFAKDGVYISLVSEEPPPSSIPSPLMGEGQGGGDKGEITSDLVKLTFIDANPNPEIIAADPQEGKVNLNIYDYFLYNGRFKVNPYSGIP